MDPILLAVVSILGTLSAVLLGWVMFGRNVKKDRKQTDEEIRASARKEAERDSKLDLAVQGIQEVKYSIKPIAEKVNAHDVDLVKLGGEVKALSDKVNEHLRDHN